MPDRYLFIVDISSPMRARADAVHDAILALLISGMQGQLKNGDQLGIWTYNDRLYTGEFALVEWNEKAHNEITRRVLQFLEKQRFGGTTDFSKVMPDLLDVVAHSRRITVILVSDGDEVIRGTPFDGAIESYFREYAEVLKRKRVPILTVMRGYKGRLIAHTINYPPRPVEFPRFPPETESVSPPVQTNAAPERSDLSSTLATSKKGPIVLAQPLIVSGRHDRTTPPPEKVAKPSQTNSSPESQSNAPATGSDIGSPPVEDHQGVVPAAQPEAAQMVGTNLPAGATRKDSRFRGPMRLVGLGMLALVVVSGGLLLMRRSRPRPPASLITKSMGEKDGR